MAHRSICAQASSVVHYGRIRYGRNRGRPIVNRRARIGPAGHRYWAARHSEAWPESADPAGSGRREEKVVCPSRVVIRRLIPLVLAGQKIVGIFVAVAIDSAGCPCLVATPKRHTPTAAVGQVVGCRLARTRIKEIDKRRRLIPRDSSRRLVSRPCPSRDIGHPAGRRLGDGVLRDLVSARAVFVGHPAIGRQAIVGVSTVARVADVDEVDGKLVAACAEGVGLRGELGAEGECGKQNRNNEGCAMDFHS